MLTHNIHFKSSDANHSCHQGMYNIGQYKETNYDAENIDNNQ